MNITTRLYTVVFAYILTLLSHWRGGIRQCRVMKSFHKFVHSRAIILFCSLFISFNLCGEEQKFPWMIYYGNQVSSETFAPYNPVIFDSLTHPPLGPLLNSRKEVLGYLDLGEVTVSDPWFALAKEKELLIRINPDWPESWLVDIRNPFWKSYILQELLPNIYKQGFSGVFLDQIDVLIAIEKENPENYTGMAKAAVDIIRDMHKLFPDKKIMMNRAYEIIPMVGDIISYELAETLYTSYNFTTKQYFIRPENEFEWQLQHLNKARAQFPGMVIFSLDYWDPKDTETIKTIYATERKQCMRPYVTSIDLMINPEPD